MDQIIDTNQKQRSPGPEKTELERTAHSSNLLAGINFSNISLNFESVFVRGGSTMERKIVLIFLTVYYLLVGVTHFLCWKKKKYELIFLN